MNHEARYSRIDGEIKKLSVQYKLRLTGKRIYEDGTIELNIRNDWHDDFVTRTVLEEYNKRHDAVIFYVNYMRGRGVSKPRVHRF
jgi:hypothetical protein